jgi:uncharacterized protein (TIGR02266 family)
LVEQFRRTDPRYDRQVEVEVKAGTRTFTGRTRNLSLGGMYLETSEVLPVQSTIDIHFRVPTQPELIEVTGEVRWVEPGSSERRPGLGIRFHGLRARDVWALNRLFQS